MGEQEGISDRNVMECHGGGDEVYYGRGSALSKRIRQGGAVTEKAEGKNNLSE